MVSCQLGRREAPRTGLVRQVSARKGEGLFGQILRQGRRLPGRLREVPAVREQVVKPDLESLGSSGRAEGPDVGAFESSRPVERSLQRRGRIVERPDRVFVRKNSGRARDRLVVEQGDKHAVHPSQMSHQLAHVPFAAGCRRHPLLRADVDDHVADGGAGASQVIGSGRMVRVPAVDVFVSSSHGATSQAAPTRLLSASV
jgi:hypothetical protein